MCQTVPYRDREFRTPRLFSRESLPISAGMTSSVLELACGRKIFKITTSIVMPRIASHVELPEIDQQTQFRRQTCEPVVGDLQFARVRLRGLSCRAKRT